MLDKTYLAMLQTEERRAMLSALPDCFFEWYAKAIGFILPETWMSLRAYIVGRTPDNPIWPPRQEDLWKMIEIPADEFAELECDGDGHNYARLSDCGKPYDEWRFNTKSGGTREMALLELAMLQHGYRWDGSQWKEGK